jgi:hypothetical protein
MKVPPLVARVRVRTGAHAFRLWVPLFLVWALLFVLLAPLFLFAVLAALLAPRRWRFGRAACGAWATFCETRGTHVDVEGARSAVSVEIH